MARHILHIMKHYEGSRGGILRLFVRMGGWSVAAALALTVVFSVMATRDAGLAVRFAQDAAVATAVVTDRHIDTYRDSEGQSRRQYSLQYTFETPEAEVITVRRNVGKRDYDRTSIGAARQVFYLPDAPHHVEFERGDHARKSRIIRIVSWCLGLAGLVGLWHVGGWAVAGERARRHGVRMEARVTGVMRTNVRVNKQPRYRLAWVTSDGVSGQSLLYRYETLTPYQAGDPIVVFRGIKTDWWDLDVGGRKTD